MKYFGAQFTSDTTLNHPTLADERRKQILAYAYHEAKRGIDRGLDAVLKLTTLIGDSTLANSIESFSNALKKAHVSPVIVHRVIANPHEPGASLSQYPRFCTPI